MPTVPGSKPPPPLLRALRLRSVQAVAAVLEGDPEAAWMPFLEHGVEPPLCAAIRSHCGDAIVELLLKHGADANSEDLLRRTPMQQLQKLKQDAYTGHVIGPLTAQELRRIETVLLQHGATMP